MTQIIGKIKTKGFGEKDWADERFNYQIGCEAGCLYCWAKHFFIRRGLVKNDEDWLNPRPNSYHSRKIAKIEGRYGFPSTHNINKNNLEPSLKIIKRILEVGNDLLITLKPHLEAVKRLCAELTDYREQVEFRFTITTDDEETIKKIEPFAPSFKERLASLKWIKLYGYTRSISIEPFLTRDIKALIEKIIPFTDGLIFIGPMNYLGELIEKYPILKQFAWLYTPETLLNIKQEVDSLMLENIRYKDTFRATIGVEEE